MPVTADRPGPYAPASAIGEVLDRNRKTGIPNPITGEVLERAGVSPSLVPRTMQALQTLDLITENGTHTDVLVGLRRAPEGEYNQRLTDWLNGAYADALQFVDPATADEVSVRDAFRNYNPFGQQPRMVSLFLGLYEKAGVITKKAAAVRAPTATPRKATPARTVVRAPAARKSKDDEVAQINTPPVHRVGNLPSALSGLLADLPKLAEGWTKADRDRFVLTFEAVLDFCFPVNSTPKRDNKSVEEDADP